MIKLCPKEECTGCAACQNICSQQCIEMRFDDEGFILPIIDYKKCISCHACINVCPELKKRVQKVDYQKYMQKVYMAWNVDQNIRLASSSGGLFTEIAKKILNLNGVVYGAVFDNNFLVKHDAAKSFNELSPMRGSKYIQSDVSNRFKEVKDFLNANLNVLFSGTPCQVAGLNSFLGKEYENLITLDFICHGVASTKVFLEYVEYISNQYNSTPSKISFRDKRKGYKNPSFTIDFENGMQYSTTWYGSPVGFSFAAHKINRLSCYSCSYKNLNRCTDITIADYILPDFNKQRKLDIHKGLSLLIINTIKGERLANSCSLYKEPKELDDVTDAYVSLQNVEVDTKQRSIFFSVYHKQGFEYMLKKHLRIPISVKLEHLFIKFVGGRNNYKKIRKFGKNIIKRGPR